MTPEPEASRNTEDVVLEAPVTGAAEPIDDVRSSPAQISSRRFWRRRLLLNLPAAWTALVFACASFTPSLLPRAALMQGVLVGITGAIGYGIGLAGAWTWRELAERPPRPARRYSWAVFGVVAVAALVAAYLLGLREQDAIREQIGIPPEPASSHILAPIAAAFVFVLLIGAARGIRWIYRRIAGLFSRWLGRRLSAALGGVLAAVIALTLIDGVLLDGLINAADSVFSARDTTTAETAIEPQSALRSGSPESLVAWDTLGRQGRSFVGHGPTAEAIGQFNDEQALDPIRAYAGMASAEDVEERARLAVADLERAGGFEREFLLVAGTTGTGWVDPPSIEAFEYLTGGDTATVAMQYSYLPSWLSFLVDQERARVAGRALYDAVYEEWISRPADARPALYVFGVSLGSFSAETAFSGEFDMRNRTSGILYAGAPGFNVLHAEFTSNRDAPSLAVEPVYRSGRVVRFSGDRGEPIQPDNAAWDGPRVLYLQHATDPIVWWSADLLWDRPAWLAEPRGFGVSDTMTWLPIITFWQVTIDMAEFVDVPPGYGHTYTRGYVDGWAQVLRRDDLTVERANRLKEIIEVE